MTENPIVSIKGLNKWYGDFHVLRDINLEVGKGERIVICGPSGSGKSTLIRCVNALERPEAGHIIVCGHDISPGLAPGRLQAPKLIERVRQDVGMVFQQFNLFPHLTVLENCTLAPIWVKKIPKKQADETAMQMLRRVKIPEQASKSPG